VHRGANFVPVFQNQHLRPNPRTLAGSKPKSARRRKGA
jgi:hypothetical protein